MEIGLQDTVTSSAAEIRVGPSKSREREGSDGNVAVQTVLRFWNNNKTSTGICGVGTFFWLWEQVFESEVFEIPRDSATTVSVHSPCYPLGTPGMQYKGSQTSFNRANEASHTGAFSGSAVSSYMRTVKRIFRSSTSPLSQVTEKNPEETITRWLKAMDQVSQRAVDSL